MNAVMSMCSLNILVNTQCTSRIFREKCVELNSFDSSFAVEYFSRYFWMHECIWNVISAALWEWKVVALFPIYHSLEIPESTYASCALWESNRERKWWEILKLNGCEIGFYFYCQHRNRKLRTSLEMLILFCRILYKFNRSRSFIFQSWFRTQ